MVGEIFAGLGAFKTMFDMAKALKDINDTAIRNGAIIDLQEQILSAQQAQTALLGRIDELEKEVGRMKSWEAEKEKYQRTAIRTGVIAYALKEEADSPSPSHYLCANCHGDGVKSYLQSETRYPGRAHVYVCHRCGADLYATGERMPDHGGKRSPNRR
jgi:hypothetical protein